LIRISGYIPEEEIPIIFIGLRPGEKLREELLGMDEALDCTTVDKVMRVQSGWIPELDALSRKISDLEGVAVKDEPTEVLKLLFEIVPTFRPLNPNTSRQIIHRVDRAAAQPTLALTGTLVHSE
jgi:FlaA1/EpsC-like NDP-sugar epimerase